MPSCEKCWWDAALINRETGEDRMDCYHRILRERDKNPCSPKEQAGEFWDEEKQKMNKTFLYENRKLIKAYLVMIILTIIIVVMGWIIFHRLDNPKVEVRYIDKIIKETKVEYIEVENEVYLYSFHATGYSPNDETQGTGRIMKSGKEVYVGAVAVDPEVIPLGTRLEIRGLPNGWDGIYIAEDTGGLIKGNRIDIFSWDKSEALQINCDVWLRILEELPMGE